MIRPDLVPKYCDSPSYNPLYMGNFQALQPRAQVTFNLLTVILFSENLLCITFHYKCDLWDRDAMFLHKGFGALQPVLCTM